MNLLEKLPLVDDTHDHDHADLTPEEIEALEVEGKKARIQFHREKVRNGPVKFSAPTSGQIRRAEKRDLDRRTRKARKAQIRSYFAAQSEAAALRGHLQQAGVIAFATKGRKITHASALSSVSWLLVRFGTRVEGEIDASPEGVRTALQTALNRYESMHGLPASQIQWDAQA